MKLKNGAELVIRRAKAGDEDRFAEISRLCYLETRFLSRCEEDECSSAESMRDWIIEMEGAQKDIMKRKPENGDILNRQTISRIFVLGLVMAIGTIAVYLYELSISNQRKAMTVAFTLFVIYQLFNAFNCKSDSDESSKYLYAAIVISLVLQILIVYIPQLQIIFKTTSIDILDWIIIIAVAFTIIISEKILNKVIE